MYLPQILLIIVALFVILLWFLNGYKQARVKDDRSSLPVMIMVAWLIAAAVFGAYFFVVKVGIDISIERLLFLMVILLIVTGLFKGKVSFQKNIAIELVMGLFVLVCLLSMMREGFLPPSPDLPSPWYTFISGYLFPFIVFVYAKNYLVNERDVTVILQALFYFGIYLSITAFFEYAELRQFVFPAYINDPTISPLHLERARGPFLNAAFNGVGILIGFISGLHLLERKTGFVRSSYLAALLLFFPAVFFTLTRSCYLGLVITLAIFLGWYKTSVSKWRLISLPLALILILGIVNSPRLLSTERRAGGVYQVQEVDIRLALLEKSFFLFKEHPLTGIGMAKFIPASTLSYKGKIRPVVEESTAQFQHNHLLGVATELGIPGILLYLILVILIFRRLKQLAGKLPDRGIMGNNLLVAILAVWCVYLNNNLFVEPSNNIFVNAAPFLFAGLADGLYTRYQESGLVSLSPVRIPQSPMRIMNSHV